MSRATAVPRELTTAPFTGAAAVAAGLLTRRQLQGDTWRRLLPGVYAWSELTLDHRRWCRAAGLFLRGRGAVSGRSAAGLWGAAVLVRDGPVEVTLPLKTRLRAPDGLTIVRSPLPPRDVTERAGVPLTSAERTAFDLGRRLPVVDAVVALDAMLGAKLITKGGLAAFATAQPGWPGIDQLNTVLLVSDAGAASPQESRLRVLLLGNGLPRPVTQHVVRTDSGIFVARLDLAYPERKIGVEYEGDHHRGRGQFQRDLRRMNALTACGWTVLRFGSADIRDNPGAIVAAVRAALDRVGGYQHHPR
jgi:very-short-patch-repair endonuclease